MTAPNPRVGQAEWRGLKLRMDFDRFCALEAATGKKMPRLVLEFGNGLGLSDLRTWIRCFAERDLSEAEAGAIIHKGALMDDYSDALGALSGLMESFLAPPSETTANPPKAA